jgi:hydrogenase expression/formation protein HypE
LPPGPLGDHGVAILSRRQGFEFDVPVESDCASLKEPLLALFSADVELHALRDPTRGGLAGVLYEWAMASQVEILVREVDIPVRDEVKPSALSLGLSPIIFPQKEGRSLCFLSLNLIKLYPF